MGRHCQNVQLTGRSFRLAVKIRLQHTLATQIKAEFIKRQRKNTLAVCLDVALLQCPEIEETRWLRGYR